MDSPDSRPEEWSPPADEHPDVTELRTRHAGQMRAWAREWINDPTVSDTDFAAAWTHLTYGHAKKIAALAIRLHIEGGGDNAGLGR